MSLQRISWQLTATSLLLPFAFEIEGSAQTDSYTTREQQESGTPVPHALIESKQISMPAKSDFGQQRVIWSSPATTKTSVAQTEAFMRSNYSKRLADMLEQIEHANVAGWLTPTQVYELRAWHNNVTKEEELLRSAGGGIIRAEDVNQLERHVNGLAYIISQQLSASKPASFTQE